MNCRLFLLLRIKLASITQITEIRICETSVKINILIKDFRLLAKVHIRLITIHIMFLYLVAFIMYITVS